MYGEGNWKADEEYRQGIKEFSATHDVAALAHEAADSLGEEEEEEEDETPPSKPGEETEW